MIIFNRVVYVFLEFCVVNVMLKKKLRGWGNMCVISVSKYGFFYVCICVI